MASDNKNKNRNKKPLEPLILLVSKRFKMMPAAGLELFREMLEPCKINVFAP